MAHDCKICGNQVTRANGGPMRGKICYRCLYRRARQRALQKGSVVPIAYTDDYLPIEECLNWINEIETKGGWVDWHGLNKLIQVHQTTCSRCYGGPADIQFVKMWEDLKDWYKKHI
jgi:hypothetical protein